MDVANQSESTPEYIIVKEASANHAEVPKPALLNAIERRLAFSPRALANAGDWSLGFIYQQMREGKLRARKAGRKTILLGNDVWEWLLSLPEKEQISATHSERARQRWSQHNERTSE